VGVTYQSVTFRGGSGGRGAAHGGGKWHPRRLRGRRESKGEDKHVVTRGNWRALEVKALEAKADAQRSLHASGQRREMKDEEVRLHCRVQCVPCMRVVVG
jgi:hypothetical protein